MTLRALLAVHRHADDPAGFLVCPSWGLQVVRRGLRLAAAEREQILTALDQTGWRIRGPAGAAALLGLQPTTLESRIKKLGLKRPR